jgi:hypothetical protein
MAKEYEQEINICPVCGFIYTLNPFDEQTLANRYKNMSKYEYDVNDISEEDASYVKRCRRQYDFIKNAAGGIRSVFEPGCASGFNLSIYARDGAEVVGVEPSRNNVASCKHRYGIELFCGTFDEYKRSSAAGKRYELIFLSHVLEHIVNPYHFIFELSKMNGRYMFIEVPTLDYKFCDEPFGMFAEEHVNYFTLDNLRKLMGKAGYGIVDANMYFSLQDDIPAGYPCVSTLWEKSGTKNCCSLTAEAEPVMSSRELLMNYLNRSIENDKKINTVINGIDNATKIAVWGTGHHTSRLLGMTGLKDKNIIKFYDSDARKNGAEYYGRKIQPFDPADMENGDVETVLVSSFVAQKAIENVLIRHGIENFIKLY